MQIVKADAPVTATAVPFKDKSVRGKLWAILPWGLFGVTCVLLLVGLIVYYADAVDHEMASELILAKMLSEGKGFILTNQWAYSSEIRFLNTQLIFAPLFWLFKSWAVVRIVGTVILHVIFLLSFYFFLASLRKKQLFPWLAIFLMLPLGIDWVRYVNFGTYYIPHFAIALTVWGLIFYALRTARVKRRNWLVVGAAVLSLCAGVGGYRLVVVLNLPLFLTAVIYWLLNLTTEHHATAVKFLAVGAITGVAAVVGLLINVLLHNWFVFNAFDNLRWCNFNGDGLVAVFMMVLTAFGYREGAIFGGGATLSNLVAFGLITLTVVSCVAIIKHRQNYTPATVLLVLYLAVGLAVLAMIGAFTAVLEFTTPGIQVVRFVFPSLLFALPIIALYLTQNRQYQIVTKKLVTTVKQVVGVVTFTLVGLACLSSYVACYYLQLGLDGRPHNQNLLTIVSNLCDAGYYAGYASFWQANVLTELSNGAVEVWCFGDPYDAHGNGNYDDIADIYLWLQKTEHATTHPTGKVFLLFTAYENSNLVIPQKLAMSGGHQFYSDSYYVVYTYDSWDELHAIVG